MQGKNSKHAKSSHMERDGVHPDRCRTSYSSYICVVKKCVLYDWNHSGEDNTSFNL